MKKLEVAIIYDKNGKEIFVAKCKLVSESEYQELCRKSLLNIQAKDNQINGLKQELVDLHKNIQELKDEVKFLKGE